MVVNLFFPQRCHLCGLLLLAEEEEICDSCKMSIQYIAGYRCSICSKPLMYKADFCSDCDKDLAPQHFSLCAYKGVAADLMRVYKKKSALGLANIFAEMLYSVYLAQYQGYSIVPVPFHRTKLRKYKEDGVERICRILEKHYGLRVLRCLKRHSGVSQKSKTRAMRLDTSETNYSLKIKNIPQKIVLLDDVYTTGATMRACYTAIREHSHADIKALSLMMNY